MPLAETFQEIVDSLPSDWTGMELDLRIDEDRYIDAATLLVTCNAQPYSRHDWHWRLLVAFMLVVRGPDSMLVAHVQGAPSPWRHFEAALIFLGLNVRIRIAQEFMIAGNFLEFGAPLLLQPRFGKEQRGRNGGVTKKKILFRAPAFDAAGSQSKLVLNRV